VRALAPRSLEVILCNNNQEETEGWHAGVYMERGGSILNANDFMSPRGICDHPI